MWRWVCLAAAAAGAWAAPATPLEGFHYEPLYQPLPTNLTIRPLSGQWHMNFTMKDGISSPLICVYIQSIDPFVKVQTFSGCCSNGKPTNLNYLKYSLKANTWNTLQVRVADDEVLLQEPNGRSVKLSNVEAVLPPGKLRTAVTEVSGVEAEEECANSCPVHHYSSTELDEKKVKEWQQERLHFYFRPAGPSSRLQYEVQCEASESKVSRWEVEIQLGAEGATAGWHLVELEQRQNWTTVRLNNTVLQDTELPGMCPSRRHVIRVVGGGSFSFKCTPPGATERTEPQAQRMTGRTEPGAQRTTEERTEFSLMTKPIIVLSVLTGIALTLVVTMFVGGIVYFMKVKRKTTNNPIEDNQVNSALTDKELSHAVHLQPPQGKKMMDGLDSKSKPSRSKTARHESEALLSPSPPEPSASASAATASGSDAARQNAPPQPAPQG